MHRDRRDDPVGELEYERGVGGERCVSTHGRRAVHGDDLRVVCVQLAEFGAEGAACRCRHLPDEAEDGVAPVVQSGQLASARLEEGDTGAEERRVSASRSPVLKAS